MDVWIGIVGVIVGGGITILAVVIAHTLQSRKERKETEDEIMFIIYMMLLELVGHHFWIVSDEALGQKSSEHILNSYHRTCWRIADEIRKVDKLQETEGILRVMFSLAYETERKRADDLNKILDLLGQQVNPNYARIVEEISEQNQIMLANDFKKYWQRQRKIQPLV
ncbi:MAG: hypothetical protein L6427_03485 [Actinomycetia bacterium]|nr:hypothetical protein [Actinomycetes bacterium]